MYYLSLGKAEKLTSPEVKMIFTKVVRNDTSYCSNIYFYKIPVLNRVIVENPHFWCFLESWR